MKTIKFRAWLPDYEAMVYSDKDPDDDLLEVWLLGKDGLQVEIQEQIWKEGGGEIHEEVRYVKPTQAVMQFTGLYDKNGKEIYEGDIIKLRYHPLNADDKLIEYYKEGVVLEDGGVKWLISGTTVLDEKNKLSHHQTKREAHRHPTQGEGWVENGVWLYRSEVIGNIHDK